jgi:hypothetical protein
VSTNWFTLLFDGNDQHKPAFDAVITEAKKASAAK